MLTLRKLRRRVQALFSRGRLDDELDEELQVHLELEVARLRGEGLEPGEARRRALAEFGGVTRIREETKDARGLRPLEDLGRDLRLGLRSLLRRPAFTTVVLLTLGVGVGGSAAIFGAVDGILLTPLPYPQAERVLAVWQHDRKTGRDEVAPANFLDWRERSSAFERLTAMEPFGLDWQKPEGPVYLPTWLVYEGFFDVFGTPPLHGRTFRDDEHAQGRGDVVVLGYRLWQSRFAGANDVLGRVLALDGRPHTVVGVMPDGFAMPSDEAVWAPKVLAGWEKQSRTSNFYFVFGRLRAGVSVAEAESDLRGVAAGLSREFPRTNADVGVAVVPLPEQMVGRARKALLLLLGAVGLVLAVVTASVASMQLARAASREREFAVRSTLGAGPGRVARQLLAENLLLAGFGTGLGFALARLALDGIRALAPEDLPRVSELRADGDVLLFAACVSLLTVLSTGLFPVLIAARAQLQSGLVQGGRGATGGRVLARAQGALVVFQLCTSLVLLIGAGLLIRSFVSVLRQERGFRSDGVVAVTVQSWSYYPKPPDRAAFVRDVVDRLSALPGVKAAGMTSSLPLFETIGAEQAPLTIEGAPPPAPGENAPLVHYTIATGGLFETLSIPLRQGRAFDARDDAKAAPVALVNEAFVRWHFPGEDPLGKRIALGGSASRQQGPVMREVVGVVGDVRRFALHEEARPGVYVPHAQMPTGANAFVVWGQARPSDLLGLTRRALWQLNPTIPIYRETTMAELVGASVRERRFLLALLSGFAAMALGLAAAGLFGLMSYLTGQRTREFGVRMALGAARSQLLSLVLKRGIALAAAGIAIGLLGALALTRVLAGLLYNVTPLDAATFAGSAAVLLATAVAASFYPAWRAATTDPIGALREE